MDMTLCKLSFNEQVLLAGNSDTSQLGRALWIWFRFSYVLFRSFLNEVLFHLKLSQFLLPSQWIMLEKIQRRAIRIIFPDLGYQEALKECNITTLHQRRQWLTERLFNEIKDNSLHKLHGLLPPRNLSTVALRRKRAFNVPLCRTNRLMNSFIMHNAAIF